MDVLENIRSQARCICPNEVGRIEHEARYLMSLGWSSDDLMLDYDPDTNHAEVIPSWTSTLPLEASTSRQVAPRFAPPVPRWLL
jgi:hypothetical protein